MPDAQLQAPSTLDQARKMGASEDDILQHLQTSRGIDPGAIAHLTKALGSTAKVNDYLMSVPKTSASPAVQQTGGAVVPPEQQAHAELKATPMQGAPGLVSEDPTKEAAEAKQVEQAGGIKAQPVAPIAAGVGTQALAAGLQSGVQKYGEEKQAGKSTGSAALSGIERGAEVGGATLVGGKILNKIGGAIAGKMAAPKVDDAMNAVEKAADDALMTGTKVNATKYLSDFTKNLPNSKSKPIWDAVTQVAKQQGIQPTNMDPDDFLKFREALQDALPEAQREGVWNSLSKSFWEKVPKAMDNDKALGIGTKIVTPPAPAPPAQPTTSVAKTAAKGAAAVGSGFLANRVKSMASYGANRMMWELLDKLKGHI